MIQKYDFARLQSRLGLSQEKFAEKLNPVSIPPCPRASKKTVEKESTAGKK